MIKGLDEDVKLKEWLTVPHYLHDLLFNPYFPFLYYPYFGGEGR